MAGSAVLPDKVNVTVAGVVPLLPSTTATPATEIDGFGSSSTITPLPVPPKIFAVEFMTFDRLTAKFRLF